MQVIQERLRPSSFEEFQGLDRKPLGKKGPTEKEILINLFMSDRAMCLLFVGPPGTGKTSMAMLLAKQYLGEYYHSKFKPYNASTEIGVKKIRGEFVDFAGTEDESGLRNIVFLDEADGIKWQAQDALRAIIEQYSYNTIFILSANKLYRLHDALISRSTMFHFDKIPTESSIEWFRNAAGLCNMDIADNIPKKVLDYYNGDLRRVITNFFTKFYGEQVYHWNPKSTRAEEIYNASNPVEKWKELATKEYIDPLNLIHELYELNGEKNSKLFSEACDRIIRGGNELINVIMVLQTL